MLKNILSNHKPLFVLPTFMALLKDSWSTFEAIVAKAAPSVMSFSSSIPKAQDAMASIIYSPHNGFVCELEVNILMTVLFSINLFYIFTAVLFVLN